MLTVIAQQIKNKDKAEMNAEQSQPTESIQKLSPAQVAELVLRRSKLRPTLAIVLGSGFQDVLKSCTTVLEIPYGSLPGFPPASVAGHPGKLILGYLRKTPLVILCGRAHYYEGYSLQQVTYPIRVLAQLGIRHLLLTNAAGGINSSFRPGDFMCLKDHINFMGASPLRGPAAEQNKRFVDLSEVYSRTLSRMLHQAAQEAEVRLHDGVYVAVPGPNYETPAEVAMFALLGADAVGMSTVPEAIVARQCNIKVAAVSCITNLAAGRSPRPLSHDEVLEAGRRAAPQAAALLGHFARLYAQKP